MSKNGNKKKENFKIFSEAFPPNKEGRRQKIPAYSPSHELLKNITINASNIIYKSLTLSDLSEIKNLHKEWFPIDYDDEYFKKIFNTEHSIYFTIGAFYSIENKDDNSCKEIIIGMAMCEFRPVSDYFIKHTSRKAIKKICDNIDFNEEVTSYLKCQDYSVVYIMTIGVIDECRKLNIGTELINRIYEIGLNDYLCIGIYLDVVDYNKSAIKFYEKNGFEKVSKIKNYYDIKSNYFDADVFLRVFTRKEKDNFRRIKYSFISKLFNYFVLTPMNIIYKIIIFFLFCQCFRSKIKYE